jgi:hypothetical protein
METIQVIKSDIKEEHLYDSNNNIIRTFTYITSNTSTPYNDNFDYEKINKYLSPDFTTDEYFVIAKEHEHLESIYRELETEGLSPEGLNITRAVECIDRRPMSRGTLYRLTQDEADALVNDERILCVEYNHPAVETKSTVVQTSNFSKGSSVENYFDGSGQSLNKTEMVNWGLLRSTLESQSVYPDWGASGTHSYQAANNNSEITTSIELTQTGKNVDLIVVDSYMVVPDHPEWFTNPDGTGTNRLKYFNWYQYNPNVTGGAAGTYPALGSTFPWGYFYQTGHPSHCMGIAAGATMGWAKDANLYHLFFGAASNGTLYDYIRMFHRNKPINPVTKRKNPTITTNSYGNFLPASRFAGDFVTKVFYRGVSYEGSVYDGPNYDKTFSRFYFNYLNTTRNFYVGYTPTPDEYSYAPGFQTDAVEYAIVDYDFGFEIANPRGFRPRGYELRSDGTLANGTFDNKHISSFTDYDTLVIDDIYGNQSNLRSYMLTTDEKSSLTSSTTPTSGTNDNGYWEINLPFSFRYGVGTQDTPIATNNINQFIFNKVYVNTNQTITFVSPSFTKTPHFNNSTSVVDGVYQNGPDDMDPLQPSIGWCAGQKSKRSPAADENLNHSIQRIYYGTIGTTPNRKFHIRIEADYNYTAAVGSSGKIWELTFYERDLYTNYKLTYIRLIMGENNSVFRRGKDFNTYIPRGDLSKFGLRTPWIGQGIPFKSSAISADIEDLIKEGVIFVGAAGNSDVYVCSKGDIEYDNFFQVENDYVYGNKNPNEWSPAYFDQLYWMRGASPNTNELKSQGGSYDTPVITVGAVDNASYGRSDGSGDSLFYLFTNYSPTSREEANLTDAFEYKAAYSNYGTGIDVWAPGTSILSVYDTQESSHYDHRSKLNDASKIFAVNKISGTSMATPQVAGVLTCALETYPYWSQYEAKDYIISYAKQNKLITSWGTNLGNSYEDTLNLGTANVAWPGITSQNHAAIPHRLIATEDDGKLSDYYKDHNRYLYYYQERKTQGTVFPKANVKVRPTEGAVFPRPRIRRSA